MKRLVKASNICDIKVMWCDDEGVECYVSPSNPKHDPYRVTYYGNYWRCTCKDFDVHFKKEYGSFLCKHILAVIHFLLETGHYSILNQEEVFA